MAIIKEEKHFDIFKPCFTSVHKVVTIRIYLKFEIDTEFVINLHDYYR